MFLWEKTVHVQVVKSDHRPNWRQLLLPSVQWIQLEINTAFTFQAWWVFPQKDRARRSFFSVHYSESIQALSTTLSSLCPPIFRGSVFRVHCYVSFKDIWSTAKYIVVFFLYLWSRLVMSDFVHVQKDSSNQKEIDSNIVEESPIWGLSSQVHKKHSFCRNDVETE